MSKLIEEMDRQWFFALDKALHKQSLKPLGFMNPEIPYKFTELEVDYETYSAYYYGALWMAVTDGGPRGQIALMDRATAYLHLLAEADLYNAGYGESKRTAGVTLPSASQVRTRR